MPNSDGRRAARLAVKGIVQGVGFRPFVYGLARRHDLSGWVRNTGQGVDLQIEGCPDDLNDFIRRLSDELPPLARIDDLSIEPAPLDGPVDFRILASERRPGAFQPISPDIALCDDCRREMWDPQDRRYRYPFINCTNCGPRFTIIEQLPYDRPLTTMAGFDLCPECQAEYDDPLNRRFHAQPLGCPACGPRLWLEVDGSARHQGSEAIAAARELLRQGRIVAIKGLGGFHLACDASNDLAVERLRQRKHRPGKPLAVMLSNLDAVRRICQLEPEEEAALTDSRRPIVLLTHRRDSLISPEVAPQQRTLGVMLPYTPLHELLLEAEAGFPDALVMTSGNLSGDPLVIDNGTARRRLGGLADAFLFHDRPIAARCDDSVVHLAAGARLPLRRARGLTPDSLGLRDELPTLLATGGEWKNTFCLVQGRRAFVSPHLGDLASLETQDAFQEMLTHYRSLYSAAPVAIAHDLHPDYVSTRLAERLAQVEPVPLMPVQHHHAHIAAVMAEHRISPVEQVIGLAFDGTGYGRDGAIWGGEFLIASLTSFERAFHLRYVPLPGGDAAIRQPWRVALAWLWALGIPWDPWLPPVLGIDPAARHALEHQLESGINTPNTSSMGRLFDAVAALVGVRRTVDYEAQAAMELEALAWSAEATSAYQFILSGSEIDPSPVLQAIVRDLHSGVGTPLIARRFHLAVADISLEACQAIRRETGLSRVALSGGVWQNRLLLEMATERLDNAGFDVLLPQATPVNDGGLSLGQAVVAGYRILRQSAASNLEPHPEPALHGSL